MPTGKQALFSIILTASVEKGKRKPCGSDGGRKRIMPLTGQVLQLFDLLLARFGAQHWWPNASSLEILIGIVLAQNTRWPNAQKALANLKRQNLLSVAALLDLPDERLAEVIQPAGHLNLKTRRLKNLLRYLRERFQDDTERLQELRLGTLREELLAIKGIGPETVDNILLYACDQPVLPVDAAAFRILQRHGLAGEALSYDELQAFFMDHLPPDAALFKEFHALIHKTARDFCGRQPLCEQCPLKGWGPKDCTKK
jgi:endonuclease-3 related protein